MSWRSWVDDCTTGILSDCNTDIPKKKVLTEQGAAFENYNKMIGTTKETYRNFIGGGGMEGGWLLIIVLLILIVILFLRKKNLLNIYIK
jgi:hypothetical protein